ncbi:MAG: Arc family DNA-binding protein [Deltaproteobacteria bacterium]|nr:Arc family DNA-binding protein [Deltaproteobacteria bacterium]
MPSITVKNIPDQAYETLKQVATSHHRSINSEIIYLIEKATTSKAFHPEQHLALAKRSREKTKKFLLTEDILNIAKEEGRP